MARKSLSATHGKRYDEDFASWTAETAHLLREHRFSEVDIEHLAEEVEDMGKSEKRELLSRLAVLIMHLLKWQFQPGKRSATWHATIASRRAELRRLFRQSPSLKTALEDAIAEIYSDAVEQASIETGLGADAFPLQCPFSPEKVLDRNFLPSGRLH